MSAAQKKEPIVIGERHRGGRPSKYDPEMIRDIVMQFLIAFYNNEAGQKVLARRLGKDPRFVAKLRDRAASMDATARSWLDALAMVPKDHPDYQREFMFRQWCLRLEPPVVTPPPAREQELRGIYMKYCTPEMFEKNCKPWLEAIARVRTGRTVALNVPAPEKAGPAEDEDEW